MSLDDSNASFAPFRGNDDDDDEEADHDDNINVNKYFETT